MYSRVSSQEQDIDKYTTFFNNYEKSFNFQFNEIVLERVSASRTKIQDRKLWDYVTNPEVKRIVVTEISRIGRNTRDGLSLIEHIKEVRSDLEIYIVMSNITIKKDMTADEEFLFDLQLSLAKREVKLLGERTKLGIQKARERGVTLGRPKGSTKITKQKGLQIKALLALGESKTMVATSVGIDRGTLYNYLKK